MRWIRALDETCGAPGACAWIVRLDDATAGRAAAPARPADLVHAAQARAADGGAARLWRRRLLRALAARRLGVHPDAIVFAEGEPSPARLVAPEPLFVSTAGRGPWSVVAIGPEPLGVDVELIGAELATLGGPPGESLRKWTAAEAYLKATGCSLDLACSLPPAGAHLQASGFAACAISHWPIGEIALAAAAEVRGPAVNEARV